MMENLTASDGTTATATLGETRNVKGAWYVYCKSAAATALGAMCTVSNAGVATAGTTTTSGAKPTLVVIPQFAIAAADEYFWGWNGGTALTREDGSTTFKVLAANCAHSVKVYTTGTAGVIDDDSSGTDLIHNLLLTETVTTQEAADCIAVGRLGTNLA